MVLFSCVRVVFYCEEPKKISEKSFRNWICEKLELNKSRTIEYLGVENEKAILKVSSLSPNNSKKRKEEFFYINKSKSFLNHLD
ncbi:hypothetical protein GS518_14700 [Leptospira interrogans]|uniref:Uncharacterized protein n=1 Tax=Leptospira interrogans serovar Icterohaemorrhagiae TaxID=90062 RepID=A0AAW4JWQ9_LEPIR|nr:hypothetical protein A6J42_08750 [Leptospira interrogans serovar Copenhageni]ASP43115.1 hypothetical protein AMR47_18740 [Leptospira interrogans]MBO8005869.1 hypothetical protein [Leptospira interrogans serovar Icterohaemorrhagiae]KAA5547647.1 hypothetical protein F3G11_18220 [Leptospira interrogans serovar Copenhageni]MBO7987138.1 hypothetical protein [Leptospira interrogans serovar Copenhageni]